MELSVVIPLYNKEKTIKACVTSVLNQTWQAQEILIVDDGSTDRSLEQLQELDSPLIRLICQPNQGVSAARNTGWRAAQTPWVAFLDADDCWLPDFLQTIQGLHSRYETCKMLATAYRFVYPHGEEQDIILNALPFEGEGMLSNYFEVAARSHPPICSSAVAIHTDALRAVGGFPLGLKSGEDLITWAKIAAQFPIAYAATAKALYIHQISNVGSSYSRESMEDPVGDTLEQLLLKSGQAQEKQHIRQYLARWRKSKAIILLEIGSNSASRQQLRKAFAASHEKTKIVILFCLAMAPAFLSQRLLKLMY